MRDPRIERPAFRLWPPSLFTIFAVVLSCADNFADPDLWLHVITGLIILDTWHIPRHAGYFSYSAGPAPWRNHEWLAQVTLAIAYGTLGVVGLKLIKLLCAAVTITAIGFGLSKTAASRSTQRVVLALTAVALAPQMQYRPQLFTYAILSVVIATIAVEVYSGPAILWPLIPLFTLWANFHGGWISGLGALGLAAALVGVQEILKGRWPARGAEIAYVTFLCALATLINPVGINVWTNVLHSAGDPLIRKIMTDWVPLFTIVRYDWRTTPIEMLQVFVPVLLFAGFVVSLALTPALSDAPLTAVAAVFAGGAFYMLRNVALGVIAVAIPLAHHVGLAFEQRPETEPREDTGGLETGPGRIAIACAIVLVGAIGGLFSPRLRTLDPVPRDAVAYMRDHGLHGNVLNHFPWGSYLIWHMMPESHVFIDGRAEEIYTDSAMRMYAEFFYDLPGGNEIFDKYHHDYILVSPKTGAYRTATADPNWKVIYRDDVAVLFARASSPTAAAVPDGSAPAHADHFYFP